MPDKKNKSFKESLSSLEEVIGKLDSEELDLENGLELFEKGVKLYKDCKKQLTVVEKKISKLTDSLREEEIADD